MASRFPHVISLHILMRNFMSRADLKVRQDEFYSKCPISLVMGEEAMYFSKLQISVNGLFYVKNKIIGRPPLAKILRPLKPCCTKY